MRTPLESKLALCAGMRSCDGAARVPLRSEPENLQYKVIILGDGATGKTSIANRFTDDVFAQQYKQTIGVDFFVKRLVLPGQVCTCSTVMAGWPQRPLAP